MCRVPRVPRSCRDLRRGFAELEAARRAAWWLVGIPALAQERRVRDQPAAQRDDRSAAGVCLGLDLPCRRQRHRRTVHQQHHRRTVSHALVAQPAGVELRRLVGVRPVRDPRRPDGRRQADAAVQSLEGGVHVQPPGPDQRGQSRRRQRHRCPGCRQGNGLGRSRQPAGTVPGGSGRAAPEHRHPDLSSRHAAELRHVLGGGVQAGLRRRVRRVLVHDVGQRTDGHPHARRAGVRHRAELDQVGLRTIAAAGRRQPAGRRVRDRGSDPGPARPCSATCSAR